MKNNLETFPKSTTFRDMANSKNQMGMLIAKQKERDDWKIAIEVELKKNCKICRKSSERLNKPVQCEFVKTKGVIMPWAFIRCRTIYVMEILKNEDERNFKF